LIRDATTILLPAVRQSCGSGGCGEPTIREIQAAWEEAKREREQRLGLRPGQDGLPGDPTRPSGPTRPGEKDGRAGGIVAPLIDLVADTSGTSGTDAPRISQRDGVRRLTAAADLLGPAGTAANDTVGLNAPAPRSADIDSPFERAGVNQAYQAAEGLDAGYLHRGSLYDLRI
jgi:hypothetical protein